MLFQKVKSELEKIDINIDSSEVVRIHRNSRPKTAEDGTRTAQSIVKVALWSTRKRLATVNKIARGKKAAIRVHPDLTRERFDLLSYAPNRIDRAMSQKFGKPPKDLADNENCFAFASLNCDLLARICGSTYPFSSRQEFDDLFRDKFTFTT